jgi:tartrate dehydratase alpha subunit/fumarate hydratase class I-like protein
MQEEEKKPVSPLVAIGAIVVALIAIVAMGMKFMGGHQTVNGVDVTQAAVQPATMPAGYGQAHTGAPRHVSHPGYGTGQ